LGAEVHSELSLGQWEWNEVNPSDN
jgi:hypothetical protein